MVMEESTGPLQAYRTEVVVDGFPRKIETLCLWEEHLLAGLQEGSLLFFKRLSDSDVGAAGASPSTITWQVTDTHRDLERKAILQMLAISLPSTLSPASSATTTNKGPSSSISVDDGHGAELSQRACSHLLLSLTADGVNVHSLPNARLRCQGLRTKGASCFAWHAETRTVAAAVKRRLLLFRLIVSEGRKGGGASKGSVDLEEVAELALPDTIVTMSFAGVHLFLGSKKQYHLMVNCLSALPFRNTSATTPEAPNTPAAAAAASKAAAAAIVTVGVSLVGTAPAPAIAVCPNGEEVLLACDHTAAFFTPTGSPSRKSNLAFKEPLIALVATDYYVVGFMTSGAEVHSLRRTGDMYVSQLMPELQGVRFVGHPGMSATDGSIFVALSGDHGVRRLVPVPLETQAELLAAAGEYQEALALAALASARSHQAQQQQQQQQQHGAESGEQQQGGEQQNRAILASPQGNWHSVVSGGAGGALGPGSVNRDNSTLEDRLRLLYGNHLFASGAWDEGAAQLALCSGRVTGLTGAPLLLLRLLPSLVPESWRTSLPDHAAGTPLLKVTEPDGPSFAAASATLLPYLMSYRTRIIAALQSCQSAEAGNGVNPQMSTSEGCDTSQNDGNVDNDCTKRGGGKAVDGVSEVGGQVAEACIRALSIIDVAVVSILLAQPEDTGALLRFVQQTRHWIDLEEGEKLLSSYGWYAELAALYKHYSKHEQGLELLYRTSQEPDSLRPRARGAAADLPGLPGVWATVRYLVTLGGMSRTDAVPLIKRHAKWVLEADPDAGLQAFLEMQPPLDPSTVLNILHQHSPHYCSMYLEAALQLGVALPQDYHSKLLLIYLQEILSKDEDALQTLKGPKGSDEESSSVEEDVKDEEHVEGAAAMSADKWSRSKSAAARANTELLFPLDPGHKRPASPAICIVPRHASRTATQDPALSCKPRSLGTIEHKASRFSNFGSSPEESPACMGGGSILAGMPWARADAANISEGYLGPDGPGLKAGGFGGSGGFGWEAEGGQVGKEGVGQQGGGAGDKKSCVGGVDDGTGGSGEGQWKARVDAQAGEAGDEGLEGARTKQQPRTKQRRQHKRTPSDPMPSFEAQLGRPPPQLSEQKQRVQQGEEQQQQQSEQDDQQGDSGHGQQRQGEVEQQHMEGQPVGMYAKRSHKRRGVRRLGSGSGLGGLAYCIANGPPPSLYERLRHLVYTSPYIDPDYVLTKLPPGQLPEIRALMLERLRRHREVLALYVHDLRSLSAAETYCDRVYASEQALLPACLQARNQMIPFLTSCSVTTNNEPSAGLVGPASPHTLLRKPSDIYLLLLQVVLHGSLPSSPELPLLPPQLSQAESKGMAWSTQAKQLALDDRMWSQLTWLLSRKCGRLDPLEVLGLMPEGVPLCNIMPWLSAALGHCTEQSRNMAVVKHLKRSESLNLREAVGRAKQDHVLLSSERICCLCYKRIGPAVFVAYPDRTLAHYVCHTRREKGRNPK